MSRPVKWRMVEHIPENTYFIPVGKPKCEIEEVNLKIEELEAMRLKDIEGLTQEECADKMHVSRQTFQNIIDEARKKVAIALNGGYAININGGNYTRNICKMRCLSCNQLYEVNYEEDIKRCPKCGSNKVECKNGNNFCKRCCRKNFELDCKNNKNMEESIMKIAIPNNGSMVNQHFGKSASFVIVTIEDKKVINTEEISTAELMHQHKGLADLLVKNGASVVITGGIGMGAIMGLKENGLEVIKGASGEYKDVIAEYINGTLEDKNVICNHHEEHHN